MKRLLVLLLISILAIFVFAGCQGITPDPDPDPITETTVEVEGETVGGGKTYVKGGVSRDITVTFPAPVEMAIAYVSGCGVKAGDLERDKFISSGYPVALFPNEGKTVWTGSHTFWGDDCCSAYIMIEAGECEADACIYYPVIVDSKPPVAYLNVCSGECVCDGCELTFTTTSLSSLCAPDEMDCYDDCSGVAGWSIEIYDAPPYDECCEVPCEEPVYTCSGTDCPVECVTPCLEAFYADGLTEFYIIFSMWDKVGNMLQEGAMVTMSDTCVIERIIPYTGAVGGEACVDPLYLTNLCDNGSGDEGEYTLTVNIFGNGSVTKNPLEATYTS